MTDARIAEEPGRCLVPTSIEEMGEILTRAKREHQTVEVLGGGTQSVAAHGPRPPVGVSTLGWEGVDIFEPDEGVVHARAGTTVLKIQETVAEEGWELPLDPLRSVSTLGGTIATGYAGPRAQAFGRVADAILGLEVLGADGVLRHCGGRVVKNVTGYDLAKLYCGAYGTLGIVTGGWLRLRPAPAERLAFRANAPVDAEDFRALRTLRDRSTLRVLTLVANETPESSSSEVAADVLYIELAGSPAEVAADRHAFEQRMTLEPVPAEAIDRLGRKRASAKESSPVSAVSESERVAMQATVLGSHLFDFIRPLRDRGFSLSVDIGLGVVSASGRFESGAELADLRREAEAAGGYLALRSMPATWSSAVDAFSASPAERRLMDRVRTEFDPERLLNPHVFQTSSADSLGRA